jgi:3-methyl-2-oxobutanoate hydroxymethyltransferase
MKRRRARSRPCCEKGNGVIDTKRIRLPDLKAKKKRGEKIAMLTAYDYTMARLLDRAGIDVLLVGDSLGMVVLGYENTLPVTLDAMVHHTRAVSRGAQRALVVADMPFLTYQVSVAEALRNAGRLIQEGGAAAVKIEGGGASVEAAARIVEAGIPVMGHLGLLPQSVHQLGGFRQQARLEEDAEQLLADAQALEEAGVFAVVLESIPASVAEAVTADLGIPTIGIGAGPQCDGQVLVSYDMLGLSQDSVPPFVRRYADLGEQTVAAAKAYAEDIRMGRYPAAGQRAAADLVAGLKQE